MIRIAREAGFLHVQTQFWSALHTVDKGGLITEVRIFHGTNTNLLARPAGASVDEWMEEFESEKVPTGMILKRGIANMVHLNAIPYIYYYVNTAWKNFAYRDWKSFIADEDAIFGLFRKFKDIDLTQYRFVGPRSGLVGVERRSDVLCSAYVGKDTLAVVSNQTPKKVPGGNAFVRDAAGGACARLAFGPLRPYEVKILK